MMHRECPNCFDFYSEGCAAFDTGDCPACYECRKCRGFHGDYDVIRFHHFDNHGGDTDLSKIVPGPDTYMPSKLGDPYER